MEQKYFTADRSMFLYAKRPTEHDIGWLLIFKSGTNKFVYTSYYQPAFGHVFDRSRAFLVETLGFSYYSEVQQ